ncbi:ATP-binding protein [Zoogloea dura]|uniref:ATP-binding protein n=1 Tax=Zoogloea dura TaxID=2728840 RepID=A0A848FYN3_9RHOO|nr:ATP-binding protein [Zoogloea dura]NML25037.1 ATP-binding protein [Zoogloea dura]
MSGPDLPWTPAPSAATADSLLPAAAASLEAELEWLASCLQARLGSYFGTPPSSPALPVDAPLLGQPGCPYAAAVQGHGLDPAERLVLALALAPSLRPQLLDVLWSPNTSIQRPYTEFGAIGGGPVCLPSGETACFLLAGDALALRLAAMRRLAPESRLARQDVLRVGPPAMSGSAGIPVSPLAGPLQVSPRFLAEALPGLPLPVSGEAGLPARRVFSGLGWHDLVLPAQTLAQLEDIALWLTHGHTLLHEWGLGRRSAPGHVSLFHGPSGTGKTLSAGLLGQRCGREVWRVDLSQVSSKYIGETEKNLARLFEAAEQAGWILFFDEADALFGKRTGVSDAHDRYANQEVSYLLQRIEAFAGVVILATNLRHNIDDAFLRRFHSVVAFPMPKAAERLRLWQESIPAAARLDPAIDLAALARRHEISGGTLLNVVRHACLQALGRGDTTLRPTDLDEGLRRELLKEGRTS